MTWTYEKLSKLWIMCNAHLKADILFLKHGSDQALTFLLLTQWNMYMRFLQCRLWHNDTMRSNLYVETKIFTWKFRQHNLYWKCYSWFKFAMFYSGIDPNILIFCESHAFYDPHIRIMSCTFVLCPSHIVLCPSHESYYVVNPLHSIRGVVMEGVCFHLLLTD